MAQSDKMVQMTLLMRVFGRKKQQQIAEKKCSVSKGVFELNLPQETFPNA